MRDERYDAMMRAVDLARTGQFSNWWTIAARLRMKRFQQEALNWTQSQREWLDLLCAEARGVRDENVSRCPRSAVERA